LAPKGKFMQRDGHDKRNEEPMKKKKSKYIKHKRVWKKPRCIHVGLITRGGNAQCSSVLY